MVVLGFNNCQPMEAIEAVDLSSNNGSGNGGGGGTGGTLSVGATYFENTLKPTLMVACASCHALPKDIAPGNAPGTLAIYTYSFMRTLIQPGPSSVNNPLFNKTSGINHAGGNQCFNDVNGSVTPCREIKAWTILEFPLFTDGIAGAIVNVSPTGAVRGWALDPKNMATAVQVNIYAGGPAGGGGTLVGTVAANLAGDGQFNGHYFNYQLPATLADGVPRNLYLYGGQAIAANLLPSMPYNVIAVTPRAAGQTFFANTVLPQLQVCVGCHGNLDYQTRYFALATPFAARGGTSLNN